MTLSYEWRLAALSGAVFFLLNAAIGAAVAFSAPLAIRLAARRSPREAARLLLMLRLLPAVLAGTIVLASCIPSYLWLEPGSGYEDVGFVCLSAAAMGMAVCLIGGARAWRAVLRSERLVRESPPCLAIAGVFWPRLIVSRAVLDALTEEQLSAALEHERAHWKSHDNLKRLLMFIAPDPLPFCSGFRQIEDAWARFTEWAADDRSIAGSPQRSLSLAAALVRVARVQSHAPGPSLATSLLGETPELAARVKRLLAREAVCAATELRLPMRRAAGVATAAASLAALLLNPLSLSIAHGLLERLME
jgi:Peptidase family M48